jgi:hypothetical protein
MRVQHSNARTREAMPPSAFKEKTPNKEKDVSNQEGQSQIETIPEKIFANSVRSLTQWYPPFVLYAHPKIEEFLTTLFPPLGQVFELGRKFCEAGRHLLSRFISESSKSPKSTRSGQ